jgi:hypothetical protein
MSSRFGQLGDKLLETSSWLLGYCDTLAKEESFFWECWWEALERIATKSAGEIDVAARLLADGKLTEPPPPHICAFLVLRLQMAAWILESLEGNDSPAKVIAFPKPLTEMSDMQIAEWLLIDFWHGMGKHLWHSIGYWEFDMWQLSHDDARPSRISDDQIVT